MRAELTVGIAIVEVLTGLILGASLTAVWELTEGLGSRVQRAWKFPGAGLARDLPIVLLAVGFLAVDGNRIFRGPGVSKTTLAAVGVWVLPIVGGPLGVAALRAALWGHAHLRVAARLTRLGVLLVCVGVAALLLRAEQVPELDPFRRYCELGAFLSVFSGVALFDRFVVVRAARASGAGIWALALGLSLSLPFLFASNDTRLVLGSRDFVTTIEVNRLRSVSDLDRDGYSALLGGGDCNDLARDVHPFNRDAPGDGVDQDCDGIDGWTPEARRVVPARGLLGAPAAVDLRARAHGKNVLVVMVDALRFDRLQDPRASSFPHLAGLFRRSVSFSRALAASSRTSLSVPAILEGTRHPDSGSEIFRELRATGARAGFVALDVIMEQLHLSARLDGVADLASGLDAARIGGVVHRDLKPQNLFLAQQMNAAPIWKILDFGVSRLADSGGTLTKDVIVGTPGYMSPEQAGGLTTTHRSNLFSFGAVVYRALTGEPPFAGPDTPQTLYQVVYRNPRRPSSLVAGLPPDVDLVLAIALAKDPADRFDTALDMAGAMRLALKNALDPQRRLHARTLLATLAWGTDARDSSDDLDEISLSDAEAIELP